jgi:hypothetical protein
MALEKYSIGIGDRFGRQGKAQLHALVMAKEQGLDIVPVWNKSHREHTMVKTVPEDVRAEADAAVKALGWHDSYYVDADHVSRDNVDLFMDSSDFFTLDVADFIGKAASDADLQEFVQEHSNHLGDLAIPGIDEACAVTEERLRKIAGKYLLAVNEAGKIYRKIEAAKGVDDVVIEISIDEGHDPQTPVELLFILAAIADEEIPAQTIAPKFTGRFNKGMDYVGDTALFAAEFEQHLAVVAFAVREFGLPENLKLSVHSGSDKFSIYPAMNRAIKNYDAGLHLKTAGTTWLEELIGLAVAGRDGLDIAREVYGTAFGRLEELCGPYLTVIDIDRSQLPPPEVVSGWNGEEYAAALRHDPACETYNPHIRQLLHVGYKVAAEMGPRYPDALDAFENVIAEHVTQNIYARHVLPIFAGA